MLHATSAARPSRPRPRGTEEPARLAGIRQALRTADMIAGKSASELSSPVEITEVEPEFSPSARHCLEVATERLRNELRQSLPHLDRLFEGR